MKKCSKCGIEKDISKFNKSTRSKDGLDGVCKECKHKYHQIYYATHKETLRKYSKEYYKNHRSSLSKQNTISRRRRRFNITQPNFLLLEEKQRGRCAICGTYKDELDKSLHIDHNHTSGKIRGLLCQKCNLGLGCYADSVILLQKAIKYLRKYKEN